jgi:hypothetical protein
MSTENVKEIVKEKYGNAALRVTSGTGNSCCGQDRPDWMGPVIQSPQTFMMRPRRARYQTRPSKRHLGAAT